MNKNGNDIGNFWEIQREVRNIFVSKIPLWVVHVYGGVTWFLAIVTVVSPTGTPLYRVTNILFWQLFYFTVLWVAVYFVEKWLKRTIKDRAITEPMPERRWYVLVFALVCLALNIGISVYKAWYGINSPPLSVESLAMLFGLSAFFFWLILAPKPKNSDQHHL